MLRLLVSVFVCFYGGALAATALHYFQAGNRSGLKFALLFAGALGFLAATLVLVRRPWNPKTFPRQVIVLALCFYAGMILGAWAQQLAGPMPATPSVVQMLIATLSFQGASLGWTAAFLREHGVTWGEAFGFRHYWRHAALIGVIVASLFFPAGLALQRGSAEVLTHVPRLGMKPEEQTAVQTLRIASSWVDRVALGVITILLVPVAEEMLFRGILYPWIKGAGFPRLALWGTALVFAAIHLNLVIFVPLFVLALALTVLYERTGNLLAPITAHSLFNALNFTMLYLFERIMG